MPSLISASEWPVFDAYEIVRDDYGQSHITPAEGAHIRTRIDLMSPALRAEALDAAIRLVKWGAPRQSNLRKAASLGTVDQAALLEYAHRFGLFGIGPAQLLRVEQREDGRETLTWRQVGRLMMHSQHDATLPAGPPVVVLDCLGSFYRPPWYFSVRHDESGAFADRIGSDAWWGRYSEPLKEIVSALGALTGGKGQAESYLPDTFVMPASRLINEKWRSVSAVGALALEVAAGGLKGMGVCGWDLCRRRFAKVRSDQLYCSDACRVSAYRKAKRVEG